MKKLLFYQLIEQFLNAFNNLGLKLIKQSLNLELKTQKLSLKNDLEEILEFVKSNLVEQQP